MTTTSAVLADPVEELAERLEVAGRAAAPLDHAELLERERVLHAGLDHEAGGQERISLRVHRVQRTHEACPRRVLAGPLQRIDEVPRLREPVDDVGVAAVEAWPQPRGVLVD